MADISSILNDAIKETETPESKAKYFDNLSLARFPQLTQAELDDLRQAIAG